MPGQPGIPQTGQKVASSQLAYLAQFQQWMNNPSTFIFGRWQGFPEGGMEGGMDVGSPGGTPVYALETGPLQGAGYFCHGGSMFLPTATCTGGGSPGYGVLTQRINVPGYGMQDIYYQHIQLDPSIPLCSGGGNNCKGYIVQKGQQIGTILPQVGMLEIGFNAGGSTNGPGAFGGGSQGTWGTIWGGSHPGPWVTDPRPLVKALVQNYGNPSTSGATGGVTLNDPFGIGTWWQGVTQQFSSTLSWLSNPIRIMKFIIGLVLITVAMIMLVAPEGSKVARFAAKNAPEIAAAA